MTDPQRIFDKYTVIRRLAVGGMGEVFLGRQTGIAGFDRLVILKTLLPELAEQAGFVEQFLNEARVAATLNHPNIVGIYEVGMWNGTYIIAMEYIHGCDLSRVQKTSAKKNLVIPTGISARIIHDAALGLDHAHFAMSADGKPLNIVHRDISPQNIMVRGDGVTKVVDFGIAKADNRSTRTATGMLKGKLAYMAPEQMRGGVVDHRADQFALGVVLWELATQRRMFKADSDVQMIQLVMRCEIPPPSSIAEHVTPELEAITMRMLSREPEDRYPRLKDAAQDLKMYLESTTRGVLEPEVGEYVRGIVGEDLEAQTRELTSTEGNFVISLSGNTPHSGQSFSHTQTGSRTEIDDGSEMPTVIHGPPTGLVEVEAPSRRPVLMAAMGALVLAVLAGAFLFLSTEEAQPPMAAAPLPVPVLPPVLTIESNPSGATVFVGETALGRTPLEARSLAPGASHELRVELKGHEPKLVQLQLEPGEKKKVAVALVAIPPPPVVEPPPRTASRARRPPRNDRRTSSSSPAEGKGADDKGDRPPERIVERVVEKVVVQPGFLSLVTEPWTKVSIDGAPHGSTPLFKVKLQPGKHTLHLVNEQAGVNVTRPITIKPSDTTKLTLKLP